MFSAVQNVVSSESAAIAKATTRVRSYGQGIGRLLEGQKDERYIVLQRWQEDARQEALVLGGLGQR